MAGPSVLVRFLGDSSGLKKAVDDTADSANGLGSIAKKTGAIVGGALVADQVIGFAKSSVNAAAEDAKAQEILAQTLKNSAHASNAQVSAVEKSIATMSKQYAVADDDLRPAFGNLVRATGDVGKAQQLLQVALDASAGTGKDLNTITMAMGKASTGSTGALAKLGVQVEDNAGKALTADQVFKNMAGTFKGQASVAAESAAGKMKSAQIQFGEFQEQIGTYLLPVVAKLASFFTETLIPAISGISDWVADHKEIVLAAFIGFATIVGAVVIPAFLTWAATAGAAAIATLTAAAPFIALAAVIAGVAYIIIKNWDTIKDATKAVWDFVIGVVKGVFNWIKDNWPLLLTILTGPIGAAVTLIVKNWDTIKDGAKAVWDFIKTGWDKLYDFFKGIVDKLAGLFKGMWDGITGAFKSAINALIDLWNKFKIEVPSIKVLGKTLFPGLTIPMPTIPHLAQGGLITSSGIVFAHAGEVISPAPASTRSIVIENVNITGGADIDLLLSRLNFAATAGRL